LRPFEEEFRKLKEVVTELLPDGETLRALIGKL
jgi:hypothetical protein